MSINRIISMFAETMSMEDAALVVGEAAARLGVYGWLTPDDVAKLLACVSARHQRFETQCLAVRLRLHRFLNATPPPMKAVS